MVNEKLVKVEIPDWAQNYTPEYEDDEDFDDDEPEENKLPKFRGKADISPREILSHFQGMDEGAFEVEWYEP